MFPIRKAIIYLFKGSLQLLGGDGRLGSPSGKELSRDAGERWLDRKDRREEVSRRTWYSSYAVAPDSWRQEKDDDSQKYLGYLL